MFAIFEPITFPKEISLKPLRAASILTNNSGADVAKETTVKPITIFDKRSLKDKATEERTKNSPPTTNSNKPRKTKSIETPIKDILDCEDTKMKYDFRNTKCEIRFDIWLLE